MYMESHLNRTEILRQLDYSGTPLVRPPPLYQKRGLSNGVASNQG